jgi:hypothetical protein
MKRTTALIALILALPASPAAASQFADDFESGVSGVWTPWAPAAPGGINNLLTTSSSVNHTLGGTQSARAWESDPAAWNGYAEFAPTAGFVRAEVYVYESFSNDGTNPAQPIANMLSLWGDNGLSTPSGPSPYSSFADYLQLGVVPYLPGGSTHYSTRTMDSGADVWAPTGVSRAAGWTKLAIEADALVDGGQVRYFINDAQVGTGVRTPGVKLRWIRLGINNKSYQNFWYDDVSVVPEPSSLALAGLAGSTIAYLARRRRRAFASSYHQRTGVKALQRTVRAECDVSELTSATGYFSF